MENHPIPQDVTGFQFKLIGSMTVKQFAYLAAGAVFATISYYTPTTALWTTVIKFTLVPIFGLTGAAFAFLPYEGRPLDTIVSHFVIALFKPNQYLYHKKGGRLAFLHFSTQTPTALHAAVAHDPAREAKLQTLLSSLHAAGVNPIPLDEKEKHYMQDLFGNKGQGTVAQPQPAPPVTTPTPIAPLQQPQPAPTQVTTAPVISKEESTEKSLPERSLADARDDKNTIAPTQATQTPPQPQAITPPVTADAAKQLGLPHLPDSPNLLIGIIKDSRENVLSSILVEVKDKDGNPVRAFKTNQLGQFASATPLPNGEYAIDFEDPKGEHAFKNITLSADGTILQPLIIVSIDAREELRKELFG